MKSNKPSLFIISALISIFAFWGCPQPCSQQLIVISPIPDSILNWVPYQNEGFTQLTHSGGNIINFSCCRVTHTDFVDCDRGCCSLIEYEVDNTILKADYPIPDITISISKMDEEYVDMVLGFAKSWFVFSINDPDLFTIEEIEINGVVYYDVLALKAQNYNYSYGAENELYADSLYYNNEKGILKINMTNGETFSYYD